jgi:glycosyltransferase involved in cell wall biosynthesis
MRLVFANQKLSYSSASTYSFDLVRNLLARKHSGKLCTTGGELRETFRKSGIDSYTVRFNFFSFRKLIELLREFQPQLIHSLSLRSYDLGVKIASSLGIAHLVTVHHVPAPGAAHIGGDLLRGVIAVNEAVREALVNDLGVAKGLIRVIRSGIDLTRFAPREIPFGCRDAIPVIGSIGRMEALKGFQYLVAAARRVLDSGREAHFVIVGEGPEESALRRQIRELALEKHVTICPPLPDLAEILGNFDVVVLPLLRGGVGLTVIEAMAMARPVVTTAVGEMLQLIADGRTGLLVGERDEDAIAQRIIDLLDRPETAQALGAEARRWVEEHYSLKAMVDGTEEFYGELVEDRG